jgi:hypothetical protein
MTGWVCRGSHDVRSTSVDMTSLGGFRVWGFDWQNFTPPCDICSEGCIGRREQQHVEEPKFGSLISYSKSTIDKLQISSLSQTWSTFCRTI